MKKNAIALSVAAAFGSRLPDHRTFPALPKIHFTPVLCDEGKKAYAEEKMRLLSSFAVGFSLKQTREWITNGVYSPTPLNHIAVGDTDG